MDKHYYQQLLELQSTYPEHYKMSGLCEICATPHYKPFRGISEITELDMEPLYSVALPTLEYRAKQDDGNANTRDRYMGILLKEFSNPVEKTENYRILYNKLYSLYGKKVAD